MTDLTYWKTRCQAAEDALRRARTRIWISPARLAVLQLLANLRAGQFLTTEAIAKHRGITCKSALVTLEKLHGAGLVDRSQGRACRARPVQWRLGHLVCVEDLEAQA